MRPAMPFHIPRWAVAAFTLTACGSAAPTFPAYYTADQLNAATLASLPHDSLGAPAHSDAPPPPSGEEGTPTPEPSPAGLRVIHASPDRGAASVSVFVDGSEVAAVQSLAYRGIAGAVRLTPSTHPVIVRSAAAGAATLLTVETPALSEGQRYTAIVHGLAAATPRLALAVSQDSETQPDAGKARVRFFHALAGLGTVDVCTAPVAARPAVAAAAGRPAQAAVAASPAAAVFANVAYGAFSSAGESHEAYVEVPSGAAITLQVRAQNARPCTGPVRGTVRVTPADRAVVTAVAVGRVVGTPAAPRQLLVCTDAPTDGAPTCTPVAIQ
jgi:Domain of unknown function (DUF4397)